jgi:hypothetical protein
MARHRLISTVSGTNIVSVFWDDDEGLLKYRGEHPTGFMVSVGMWLHLVPTARRSRFQEEAALHVHEDLTEGVRRFPCGYPRIDQVRPGQPRKTTARPGAVGSLGGDPRGRGRA